MITRLLKRLTFAVITLDCFWYENGNIKHYPRWMWVAELTGWSCGPWARKEG